MHIYQLLTGNRSFADSMNEQGLKGDGWRLTADVDDTVGELHAVLHAPDGAELHRFPIKQGLMNEIVIRIRRHVDSQEPELKRYQATTGSEPAAAALEGCRGDDWILRVGHLRGQSVAHVQLIDNMRAFEDVPVDPIRTLTERVAASVQRRHRPPLIKVWRLPSGTVAVYLWLSGREYEPARSGPDRQEGIKPGPNALDLLRQLVANWCLEFPGAVVDSEIPLGDTVAETVTPAPPGAAEAARAQRQVGRLLQEGPENTGPDQPASADWTASQLLGGLDQEPIYYVPLEDIKHNPGDNQREVFENIEELAQSIREAGEVLQPVILNERKGDLLLVMGERRYRAAKVAGLHKIPARIRQWTDQQAQTVMAIENLQRKDLNPIEEARAYRRLLNFPDATQETVAKQLGVSRSRVAEHLQLLDLPADIQFQVAHKRLAVKAALAYRAEVKHQPAQIQQKVAEVVAKEVPSIRKLPEVVERVLKEEGVTRPDPPVKADPKQGTTPSVAAEPSGRPDTSDQDHPRQAPAAPPRVDPSVERAKRLAEAGAGHWRVGHYHTDQAGELMFSRNCYLTLETLLEHWAQRQQIGANSLPAAFGSLTISVPEQRWWIMAEEPHPRDDQKTQRVFEVNGVTLTIRCGNGGWSQGEVQAVYTGKPVYYRAELWKGANGGHKSIYQQVVIEDGNRHIIITGTGTAQIRADLVPRWEELVNRLPGLPDGGGE